MSDARTRPARTQYMDALLGRLRETGFPAEATCHAYHVLDAHTYSDSQHPGQPGPLDAPCQSFALPDQVADEGVPYVPRRGDEDDDAARRVPGRGHAHD